VLIVKLKMLTSFNMFENQTIDKKVLCTGVVSLQFSVSHPL